MENKPKNKMRIYEDQTQIPDFTKIDQEPEWIKILKEALKKKEQTLELKQLEHRYRKFC